jgi:hypothetical protein
MSEHGIGFFAGALVAVFLVSRLLLWLMRSWEGGGLTRISIANCFSWILASFFGGMGMGLRAATIYIVPQSVVMIFDVIIYLWRQREQLPATPKSTAPRPARAPLPIAPRPTRAPLPTAPRPITRRPPEGKHHSVAPAVLKLSNVFSGKLERPLKIASDWFAKTRKRSNLDAND